MRNKQRSNIDWIAQERTKIRSNLKFCLNPNCTNQTSKIAWCHTISQSKQLSVYVGGKCLVYQPHSGHLYKGKPNDFTRVRVSSALTFRGYCEKCDQTLFTDADQASGATDEFARQQGLRAISYRTWDTRFEYQVDLARANRAGRLSTTIPTVISNHPYFGSNRVSEQRYTELSFERARLAFSTNARLTHHFFELDADPGFRASGALPLTVNLAGGSIKIDWSDIQRLPLIVVSVLSVGGVPTLVVSYEKLLKRFGEKWVSIAREISDKGYLNNCLHWYFILNNIGATFPLGLFRGSKEREYRVAKAIENTRRATPEVRLRFYKHMWPELSHLKKLRIK